MFVIISELPLLKTVWVA